RSNGERELYFITENQSLIGNAESLEDALARCFLAAEDPAVWPVLLPPSAPSKIVCIGLNYRQHAEEMGKEIPAEPLMFLKPPSALLGHGGTILRPPQSDEVH